MLFYKMIQETSAIFASMVTYIMPIVSVSWGVMVGEHITWLHFVGFLLILCGVYLIQKKSKNEIEQSEYIQKEV